MATPLAGPFAHAGFDHASAVFTALAEPVLEVDQAELFTLGTRSLLTGGFFEAGEFEKCSIPVTGPVLVRGVRPGDALRVDIHGIRIADRGAMVTLPGRGAFSEPLKPFGHIVAIHDREVRFADGVCIPVRSMVGKLGVAPADGAPSSSTVGPYGGNMDCKDVTAGSAVILPVQTTGGLLFAGDLHAAQGDGECSLTGVEVEGSVTLSCRVLPGVAIRRPVVLSGGRVITIGDGDDLDEAARAALDAMLDLVVADRSWPREKAAMLLSAAADVAVSQLVNARASVKVSLAERYFLHPPF
ncbi:Acetamidase/Formamidase [Sinomonas atrocyanea]|uniref:Acetamidase/Formamidase n=1 Tax=Sinomonas atrocyanea TaxID=37927 RepID=A0A127A4W7_9MICC|nr:acetamidase/formamidase family protein [Sinomonas atrocyanea]AMM34479.1 Acetamidase/Formamidase [Sinomonas atrocyanea]GEB65548.1 acetamidase [Sinomonas atrocyanea]GGG71191.1 acetamidase [Sinomonas atrocyanea]